MPTYEYKCKECGKTLEAFQKITADPLKECPHCHQPTLRRCIGGSNATLQFKGKGFYITDYCKNDKNPDCKNCSEGSSSE
ncbi:MAG: FmdB family zinc ribbon protein [Chlamydiota bacterium]